MSTTSIINIIQTKFDELSMLYTVNNIPVPNGTLKVTIVFTIPEIDAILSAETELIIKLEKRGLIFPAKNVITKIATNKIYLNLVKFNTYNTETSIKLTNNIIAIFDKSTFLKKSFGVIVPISIPKVKTELNTANVIPYELIHIF